QYATLLVVLDRAIGMIAMLTVCIITSILSAPEALKQYVFPALKSITLALPVMILGMYFIVTALKKKSDFLMQVNRYVKAILTSRHLLKIIGYGGLVPLLYCAPAYILALDLGLDVSLNAFLSILTFITVISAVPISVAGWGVREGLMVFLLGFYGLSQEIAISLSIMIGIINLCAAIPGMFLFLDFKHMGLNHVKSKV
ncbi:MAG: lysylphosphatidylglycerol synthase transmembrane domain-containing protein, partial [Alphaproteobacteria bacterium]|nr:lysylphosphatidylglycerol synthase transmembrane domain-containing protein [Alphaproteobacteria bacterium]